MTATDWKPTACILCSENCGIEVLIEDGHLVRIKGDRHHPSSRGYLCDKASALDHYQNNSDRLSRPLRRARSGSFEEISWDAAIAEIAERIVTIRDAHGGHSLAFYGGAGQGNQLALVYAVGFRFAMRTPYMYHALGQEKTGDVWLDGKLYGSQANHTSPDVEHTDFVIFSGTNPWHAHGFPRARKLLHEISADANRTMVVIDPRRTETAELADIHLQVRPGTDAFVLAAMLATIVEEGLENREFLARRTTGFERVAQKLREVPVDRYAEVAGVDPADVRRVARGLAAARGACVRSDLGLQQSFHSTLNLYLEKLFYLLTGNFGRRGGNHIHAQTVPLLWHSDEHAWNTLKTKVTGMGPIAGFYPPNVLPAEIHTDHPGRIRGLVVDSANPVVTGANSPAYRRAFQTLELLVVIDTAFTETAELAHFVLPACSQYEKYECTFFNWGYPVNHQHVRHPLFPPKDGTLSGQEIYTRLVTAMKEDFSTNPIFGPLEPVKQMPALQRLSPQFRQAAAPLMMALLGFADQHRDAVLRAGVTDQGKGLAAALFDRIINSPSGSVISVHEYEDTFAFIRHADGRIHLDVDEMFAWMDALKREAETGPRIDPDYPLLLSAGERRSSNATTNYRNPTWRKVDPQGALRIHPQDAGRLRVGDGDRLVCESRAGAVQVVAQVDDSVRPGTLSLPHGFGLKYGSDGGERVAHGPQINLLSASDHCDPLTKTPYHKNIPVRLRKAELTARA